MGSGSKKKSGGGDDQRPLLWRLPEVTSTELGKIGPAFGLGVGCGVGAGVGFFGEISKLASGCSGIIRSLGFIRGAGLGYGFPGLTLGFGVGAGCGVGFGFGYGLGKGIAYDQNKRYSNVGTMFQEAPSLPIFFAMVVRHTVQLALIVFWTSIFVKHTWIKLNLDCATRDTVAGLVDELVVNTKKLVRATSKEIEKWR
ncbi:hypothetical protein OsJ_33500 [Oryza sativa Japonica Group]|uniref:Uncharacterized protein n=1 Tax=Oryza sativa subsp. japonica TaxID=39947 RepID=B9GA48_ORYSJ|nr:hypothetical protein OsJ_33500 [Oryza sativa Japonica Group]